MMVDTSDDWPPEGHGAALLCYRQTTRSLIAREHRCKHLGDGVQKIPSLRYAIDAWEYLYTRVANVLWSPAAGDLQQWLSPVWSIGV